MAAVKRESFVRRLENPSLPEPSLPLIAAASRLARRFDEAADEVAKNDARRARWRGLAGVWREMGDFLPLLGGE